MKEDDRRFSDETIKAFEGLNSYLRHKALGNVNTATLALELIKYESEVNLADIASNSLSSLSLMLIRSHELQSIFELNKKKFAIKEIIKVIWQNYRKESISIEYTGEKKVFLSNFFGNIFSCFIRNSFINRGANKIVIHNEVKGNSLIMKIMDNGDNLPINLMEEIKNNSKFSSKDHLESDVDIFIAKEILKAHNIILDLGFNDPKGGIFTLQLFNQHFTID
jgi:K+-sensing histidine kinase KdpD